MIILYKIRKLITTTHGQRIVSHDINAYNIVVN